MPSQNDEKVASFDRQLNLLRWLIGIQTTILIGAIPWAYSIHGRVSVIETRLSTMQIPPAWFEQKVEDLEGEVDELSKRVNSLLDGR